METSTKVMVNSVILYIKIIISMLLSLVTVPIILRALGENDYGIYNLIAGIIAMLAFLNASMSIATQRYLSVSVGEGNQEKLNDILNTSIVLHVIVGIVIIVLLEVCYPFLFDGFLKIEPDRISAAKVIYQLMVANAFLSILAVPMEAYLNAKENMLSFSLIYILKSVLMLLLAFYLLGSPGDRLLVYGYGVLLITVLTTVLFYVYVLIRYRLEIRVDFRNGVKMPLMRTMTGFMGWSTLGSFAMLGRSQGIAFIFNIFFGTVANAAYGIANQVNGALSYFSSTFQKAINPQLMQSEGMSNRTRLIRIAYISSKFSVLVLALFSIPLIIEMPYVLKIWLGKVPDYTLGLCQLTLILALVYQYSAGLMSAVQAVGDIKKYFIVMSILILLNLPISYVLMKMGFPIYTVMVVCIIIEFISFIVRLRQADHIVGINFNEFFRTVFLTSLVAMALAGGVAFGIHLLLSECFARVVVVSIVYVIVFLPATWFIVLNADDKEIVRNLAIKVKGFIGKK